MVIGRVFIMDGALHTRSTVYSLSREIDAKADRIGLVPGLTLSAVLGLFIWRFADLLSWAEILGLGALIAASLFLGFSFAQLVIVKPSLRGSELSVAAVGTHAHVRAIAGQIVEAAHAYRQNQAERASKDLTS